MALSNPYEPPQSEVAQSQALPLASWAPIGVLVLLVCIQLVFDAFYVSFLTTLMNQGAISFVHYVTMIGSDILLLGGTLLLVLRSPWATRVFLAAAVVALGSLLLGIWYQVITCLALAVVGALLSKWLWRHRRPDRASPSEA